MSAKVQKLLEALPRLDSTDDLGVLIESVRDVYALEHVVYLALSLGREKVIASAPRAGFLARGSGVWRSEKEGFAALTYSADWVSRYRDEGYERIDPILIRAPQSFLPIDWKAVEWDTKQKKRFLYEAVDSGVGNQGYTVPVRGPNGQFALFTINKSCADSEWEKFIRENAGDLLIIAHFFHQKVLEAENIDPNFNLAPLSTRERDVLTYLSLGKSREQVAYDMKISTATIRVYIDSARHKLGALNVNHAIALGIRRGIVNI